MTKDQSRSNQILLRPRLTEKAALLADRASVYVFEVMPKASKKSISTAVHDIYKVIPKKVRVAAIPFERVFRRGKKGIKGGGKKAYVYLKRGDKIEII